MREILSYLIVINVGYMLWASWRSRGWSRRMWLRHMLISLVFVLLITAVDLIDGQSVFALIQAVGIVAYLTAMRWMTRYWRAIDTAEMQAKVDEALKDFGES